MNLGARYLPRTFDLRLGRAAYLGIFIFILLVAFVIRVLILDRNYEQGWDEGAYLMSARLIALGYQPFTQIYMPQLPLFLYYLAWGQHWVGDTVIGGRLVVVGFSLFGIAATAQCARILSNRVAALAAAFVLAINPGYFVYSRAVYLEVPASALAMGALLCVLQFTRAKSRGWLVFGGLLWASSVLMKPFYLGWAVTLVLFPLLYRLGRSDLKVSTRLGQFVLDGLVIGAAALVPVLFFLATNNLDAFYYQFIVVNLRLVPEGIGDLSRVINFLGRDWGMLALAVVAAIWGVRHWRVNSTLPVTLGIIAILGLVLRVPHFNHHDVVLIAPLAVLSGVGLGILVDTLNARKVISYRALFSPREALALAGLVAFGIYLVNFPRIALFDFRLLQLPALPMTWACVAKIQAETPPGTFVVSDQPMLVYRAGRVIPPEVAIASGADIQAGGVTEQALIDAATNYHASLIVISPHSGFLDTWTTWVAANYTQVAQCSDTSDEEITLYQRR